MTRPEARTVVVASSSRLFREAVSSFLGSQGWKVAGSFGDGLEVLGEVGRRTPDAVLILHDLARLGPGPLAREVRRRWPEVAVVVLGEADASGARILPATATSEMVLETLAAPPLQEEASRGPTGTRLDRLQSLTPRERQILRLLASGAPRGDIASALGTSPHTVRTHIHNLYRKLDAHSHLDIVRFATQHGLVEAGPTEESD